MNLPVDVKAAQERRNRLMATGAEMSTHVESEYCSNTFLHIQRKLRFTCAACRFLPFLLFT